MHPGKEDDAWRAQSHYDALGVLPSATQQELRKAYRALARVEHPDKGGCPERFVAIQEAYAVLSDPGQRRTYDAHSWQARSRFAAGANTAPSAAASGDADVAQRSSWVSFNGASAACTAAAHSAAALLAELAASRSGPVDPATQLVVTCELCRRPATKQCWVCAMHICSFCCRSQHWKGRWALHWPLVAAPGHMVEELGRREMERKRVEDALREEQADPHYRSLPERQVLRAWQEAAALAQLRPDRLTWYDYHHGGKYYKWCQSAERVYCALFCPPGEAGQQVVVQCSGNNTLLVELREAALVPVPGDRDQAHRTQSAAAPAASTAVQPPLLHRQLAGALSSEQPLQVRCSQDNRFVLLALMKATPGQHWPRLFVGDSDGVRAVRTQQPYLLTEADNEVTMTVSTAFWTDADDVRVKVTCSGIHIAVRNQLHIHRQFWTQHGAAESGQGQQERSSQGHGAPMAVLPEQCVWSLADGASTAPAGGAAIIRGLPKDLQPQQRRCHTQASSGKHRVLMLTLTRPPPTEEEVLYKKGERQDNRAMTRPAHWLHRPGAKGAAFLMDDEDEFGLEGLLMEQLAADSEQAL